MNTSEFVPAQTSIPDFLMTHCHQLADVHYQRKLNRMYLHMLQGFLAYEPWKASPSLPWRKAKIHRPTVGTVGSSNADLGWVPMNMRIPIPIHDQIQEVIQQMNRGGTNAKKLSLRTFLYTAVYWWVTSVFTYQGPGLLET